MNPARQVERQRAFYASGAHAHLRPIGDDYYARNIVTQLVHAIGLRPQHRVLEVGAGFGRFTLPLLDACDSVVALDVSERALRDLERVRDASSIAPQRCQLVVGDVNQISPQQFTSSFDAIVGFFFLHHLPDYRQAVRRLTPLLASGARMAFVEPNRRNPLFLAQVACCADMTWREEKGMFRLSRRGIVDVFRDAGLCAIRTETFGFFPPQIYNRFTTMRSLEGRLQGLCPLRSFLPFIVTTGEAAPAEAPSPAVAGRLIRRDA